MSSFSTSFRNFFHFSSSSTLPAGSRPQFHAANNIPKRSLSERLLRRRKKPAEGFVRRSKSAGQVQPATLTLPTEKSVFQQEYCFKGKNREEITIIRCPKQRQEDEIKFLIKQGENKEHEITMQIKDADIQCGNRPTLGYSNLFLPEVMDDENIKGMLHIAAAEAATLLHADRVVIDDMFNKESEASYNQRGMSNNGGDYHYYASSPSDLLKTSRHNLKNGGWSSHIAGLSPSRFREAFID